MYKLIILTLLILFPNISLAANKVYGNIEYAQYVRNYDGDTITFNIPNIHPLFGHKINIRVYGIDTPEIRGKCLREKELAKHCKHFVENHLRKAKKIELKNTRRDKYFRVLCDVFIDDKSLADILIKSTYAVPYDGGKKTKDWCND